MPQPDNKDSNSEPFTIVEPPGWEERQEASSKEPLRIIDPRELHEGAAKESNADTGAHDDALESEGSSRELTAMIVEAIETRARSAGISVSRDEIDLTPEEVAKFLDTMRIDGALFAEAALHFVRGLEIEGFER